MADSLKYSMKRLPLFCALLALVLAPLALVTQTWEVALAGVAAAAVLVAVGAHRERRLAQRAVDRLADSEGALAEAQRLAHIGSFELEFAPRRTSWSLELHRILGREPGSFRPSWRMWQECVHPGDRARVVETFERAYAERSAGSLLHRIVRPDGNVRTVDVRFQFEVDAHGRPVRLHGTCQDVTALTLAEQRFRRLFEDAALPTVVVDCDGRIALSNARAQRLFGLMHGELAGAAIDQLVPTPAGSDPWWRAPARDCAQPELELWGRRRDGSEFPVEVSLTPLQTEDGELVSVTLRDVTAIRQAAETLTHQARHDQLTGLPNRLMFHERLEQALARARRSGRALGVVFVDLDDFKEVNDTRGHDAGDLLLSALTPRLLAAVRHGDTVARLGGDEFVVLCEELDSEQEAMAVAQRLADAAREPVMVAGLEHSLSASAGVVMVPDPAQATADGVLRDADAAMYAAKAGGKGRVAVFDGELRERLLERVAIEQGLRGAVARGELELHYQPVVRIDTGTVTSVEALLRWHHPVRGLIEPTEFIAIAESAGLVAELGEWALTEACLQAAAWQLPVSVNVSAYELTRGGLRGAVTRALQASGLEPSLLSLELTEAALLESPETARRELEGIKRLGVGLIVDDFGTGYSSLQMLRRLGVGALKLDSSFVQALGSDPDARAIVAAVVGVALPLGAQVIAEGVETRAQADRLARYGCLLGQGYLFARPAPAGVVTDAIRHGSAGSSPSASTQRSTNSVTRAGSPDSTLAVSRSSM